MKIKIAWLAPFNILDLSQYIDQEIRGHTHNATWIKSGARALVDTNKVELHLITHDKRLRKNYNFECSGVIFHLLKTPISWIPRPVVFYQLDKVGYLEKIKTINPDIIHGHGTENLFSYITIESNYPNVISTQAIISYLIKQYHRVSRRAIEHLLVKYVEKRTIRRAKNIIIEAPFIKNFIRILNREANIFLLENIVEQSFFRVRRDFTKIKPKILFVGTLINPKGIELLIKVFHILAINYRDIELHLIGSGTKYYIKRVLKRLASSGQGVNRIFFRGHLDSIEIANEFKDAMMLVLPTFFDSHPNVIAEANVAGVPVISTDVGGIPFMIKHNKTGLIIKKNSIKNLKEAIEIYLEEEEFRKRISINAMKEARLRYCKATYLDKILHIYNTILLS